VSETLKRPVSGFPGLEEIRFPLELTPANPEIRKLWSMAKASTWDAERDIAYGSFDPTPYTEEQLEAAALFWSRRAWSEYTGIAESPVILLRMAFDGFRTPEAKYVLASKMMDEAKHTEASYLLANTLGTYTASPPGDRSHAMVARLRERGLNADYCFEAAVAGWHCVSETVAVRLFGARYKVTTNPVVSDVLHHIIQDEIRHINVGWLYLDEVMPEINDDAIRANVRETMIEVIENVELAGFHSGAATQDEGDPFTAVDAIVAEAGLGAATAEIERQVLQDTLDEIKKRAAAWGVEIPDYNIA